MATRSRPVGQVLAPTVVGMPKGWANASPWLVDRAQPFERKTTPAPYPRAGRPLRLLRGSRPVSLGQFDDLADRLLHIPNAWPRSAPSTRHNRKPIHRWLLTVMNPKWIRTFCELSEMKTIP
jgi:hypothetical protein